MKRAIPLLLSQLKNAIKNEQSTIFVQYSKNNIKAVDFLYQKGIIIGFNSDKNFITIFISSMKSFAALNELTLLSKIERKIIVKQSK